MSDNLLGQELMTDLAPFLNMTAYTKGGRDVTIGDMNFVSAEDRWSTCFLPVTPLAGPGGSTAQIAAGLQQNLFRTPQGQAGQGTALALTVNETSLRNGNREAANQSYVATRAAFSFYFVNTGAAAAAALQAVPINNPVTVQNLAQGIVWNLNIGDTIDRAISPLAEYPAGAGAWGSAFSAVSSVTAANSGGAGWATNGEPSGSKRKLNIPIVFPPQVDVDISVRTGSGVGLYDNLSSAVAVLAPMFPTYNVDTTAGTTLVAVKCVLQGYRMTSPV